MPYVHSNAAEYHSRPHDGAGCFRYSAFFAQRHHGVTLRVWSRSYPQEVLGDSGRKPANATSSADLCRGPAWNQVWLDLADDPG